MNIINEIICLFIRNNFIVDQMGDNSWIAYNGDYFIPFSLCVDRVTAVSYSLKDKDSFVESWMKYNESAPIFMKKSIGGYAFEDFMSSNRSFTPDGNLANHDLSDFEIGNWISNFAA